MRRKDLEMLHRVAERLRKRGWSVGEGFVCPECFYESRDAIEALYCCHCGTKYPDDLEPTETHDDLWYALAPEFGDTVEVDDENPWNLL